MNRYHALTMFVLLAAFCPAVMANEIDFRTQIQPILAKNCYACHGPDEAESGLRFTSREDAFAETESGSHAIVAGNLDDSLLYQRIVSDDESERMPPEGDPISEEDSQLIARWIQQGATWQNHWAFEPRSDPEPPKVDDRNWSSNPIDAFIFDGLQKAGLSPNAPAEKTALIRRAYYGLTGLPPTKQQVEAFLADESSDAFSGVVDQLLGSVHYGERWGRHWLDLVRFAETNSFERDGPKQNAWKYRNYVIRSFNDDKPYDQFVREQLAGDELDHVTKETLTATGYYRLGIWDDEPADPLQARFDGLDDIIMTTGQVFLGLTINCARCHDHKIDPIPQTDYYGLLSFFEDVTPYGQRGNVNAYSQVDVSDDTLKNRYAENDARRIELENELRDIEQDGISRMSAPDQRATEGAKRDRNAVLKQNLQTNLSEEQRIRYAELKKKLKKNAANLKALPSRERVMGLANYRKVDRPTYVLFRGSPHSPTDEVTPRFPELFKDGLPTVPSVKPSQETSIGRRRILADWITKPQNRLTARVMVNRIWQYHFGRGIVRSTNNFGQLGTPPTHPKLLDYLANRFISEGWSIKSMHRLILSSRAYQMSSAGNEPSLGKDPDNDHYWRFDPRRLSAEEVRDSILAVSGSLNRSAYGQSIYPQLSAEVLSGQSKPGSGWGKSPIEQQNRRSVYIYVKRSLLTPMLSAFDFPDPDQTCEARFMTLQPAQALSLLNGGFAHQQAARLAETIDAKNLSVSELVKRVIPVVLTRDATDEELESGKRLIESLENEHGLDRSRACELYCLSVLNWNEFLFLD